VYKTLALIATLMLAGSGLASAASFQPDAKAKAFGGFINANGTISYGTGYSSTRLGTGSYKIVFPSGTFKTCPIISLTTAGGNGDVPIANLSSYSCSNGGATLVVGIVGRTNGNLQDNSFQVSATPI
jgi:hypothetical protein